MKLLARLLVVFFVNAAALALIAYVPGITVGGGLRGFLILVFIFTALSLFIKPVLKIVLSPLIILTLGAGLLAINAALLFVLDLLSEHLTIQGALPLAIATLIVSAAHFAVSMSKR